MKILERACTAADVGGEPLLLGEQLGKLLVLRLHSLGLSLERAD